MLALFKAMETLKWKPGKNKVADLITDEDGKKKKNKLNQNQKLVYSLTEISVNLDSSPCIVPC